MAINLPLINGRRYSFASTECTIQKPDGSTEIFIDIRSIDYSEALEVTKVMGTSRLPVGWTAGQYNAEDASLVLGKTTFQKLIDSIGDGWMGADIVITLSYSDTGEPLTTDRLTCRIIGAADSHATGPEELNVTLNLAVFVINRNNLNPVT